MMKKLMTFAIASLISVAAHASKEVGNGGDICEDRIKIVRDDIATWINQGGAEYLKLPAGISLATYKSRMLAKMKDAKIACGEQTISIDQNDKTCMNFVETDGTQRILCNFDRFNKTSESDQYVLVHHEFAGLAGFETTLNGDSNYEISNQLTGSLADQVVKKLVVKPTGGNVCANTDIYGVYAGKFIDEQSKYDSFPVAVTILKSGTDRSGCPVMLGYYERPDLVSNAGVLALQVKFDETSKELTMRSYNSSTDPIPGHTFVIIKGPWAPTTFTLDMQWWQISGKVTLTRCKSERVNRYGECAQSI